MKKHTNFFDEVDYEEAPESWLVQAVWITPTVLLVGWLIIKLIWGA